MTEIIFILIAWLVQMPLWLSIVITVYCGLSFVLEIIKQILQAKLKKMEAELQQKIKDKLRRDWDEKI